MDGVALIDKEVLGDCDGVIIWLGVWEGVPDAVWDVLAAHVNLSAFSSIPRYGSDDDHDAVLGLYTLLLYTTAVPLAGMLSTAVLETLHQRTADSAEMTNE
jgi:hypothetical protein